MSENVNIWDLLAKRFPAGEWALLQEVRDMAGHYASRAADGIAVNLWPSRGLEVHGIEIKSYRGDWLREWKNPKKAENIFQYCDRFWLVVTNSKIIIKEELPATWGLLEASGNRLKTIVEAPKLTPQPLTRHFVASMLKRATKGMIAATSIESRITQAAETAVERYKNDSANSKTGAERRLDKLNIIIESFENSSGIKISDYYFKNDAAEIGKLLKAFKQTNSEELKKRLSWLTESIEQIRNNILATINEFETMERNSRLPNDDRINKIREDLLTMFEQSIGWKFRIKGSPLIDEVVGVDREMSHVCGKMYGNFHVDLCELTNEETHLAN